MSDFEKEISEGYAYLLRLLGLKTASSHVIVPVWLLGMMARQSVEGLSETERRTREHELRLLLETVIGTNQDLRGQTK